MLVAQRFPVGELLTAIKSKLIELIFWLWIGKTIDS